MKPAVAQVPLVVGSVRDQHGAPIEAASVEALSARGAHVASALTDRSGTFSLPGSDVVMVTVGCRYCVERRVAITPGEPVVAIVRRFEALGTEAPSVADLANLPYAMVESALSLRPFTLLRQTTSVLPGPQLSDRGFLPSDALVVDAGVPNYDVAFGVSPYYAVPAGYDGAASIVSPVNAYTYGDRAGSGIVVLDPFQDATAATLTIGGDSALRLSAQSPASQAVGGASQSPAESRQRADARWTIPFSETDSLSLGGGVSQYRQTDDDATIVGNVSFAKAAFDDAQPTIDTHAAFVADRAGYVATLGPLPMTDVWSDAQFSAGVQTSGPIAAFAEVSNRVSTGLWDAAYAQPRIAGTITQNRATAGVMTARSWYALHAGVGGFTVAYTGGSFGRSLPSTAQLATPSLRLQLFPHGKWSSDLEASGGFALPTLWQQYSTTYTAGSLTYDRTAAYAATLTYTDNSRLRASAEAASQRVRGTVDGVVTSSGLSLTWQVAPALSLRAWTMYFNDATAPAAVGPPLRSGPPPSWPPLVSAPPSSGPPLPGAPQPGTASVVNAYWLTYENGENVRLDAVFRRDLLDGGPFEHLDGSVSGPLSTRLRWYAGVEDRRRTTYLGVGLRLIR